MRSPDVSSVLLAASAALCVAVIVDLNNSRGSLATVTLYGWSLVAAASAVATAAFSRVRRKEFVTTALFAFPIIVAHAMWSFYAFARTSVDPGHPPNCSEYGIDGSGHVESEMFPTAKWCVSDDDGARAMITPLLETITLSAMLVLITLFAFGLAVYLWRGSIRGTRPRPSLP